MERFRIDLVGDSPTRHTIARSRTWAAAVSKGAALWRAVAQTANARGEYPFALCLVEEDGNGDEMPRRLAWPSLTEWFRLNRLAGERQAAIVAQLGGEARVADALQSAINAGAEVAGEIADAFGGGGPLAPVE